MSLSMQQQKALEHGDAVAVNSAGTACVLVLRDICLGVDLDFDTGPWTLEEMNLLADEAEETISRSECHGHRTQ